MRNEEACLSPVVFGTKNMEITYSNCPKTGISLGIAVEENLILLSAGTMEIMNRWRKHQMRTSDSRLSTKPYLQVRIFGTRINYFSLGDREIVITQDIPCNHWKDFVL